MWRPALVIFDLDGTLVDAYEAIHLALDRTLRAMGLPGISYDDARRSVGGGDLALLSRLVPACLVEKARAAYRAQHLAVLSESSRLMPGALRLLLFLRETNIRIAAATNRSRTTALPLLESTHILQFFDLVVAAEDVQHLKPHPEQILRVLHHFSCSPDDALFVGDMVVDLEAGRAAGVRTFIVVTGSSLRSEFDARDAMLFDNLDEVRRRIANAAAGFAGAGTTENR